MSDPTNISESQRNDGLAVTLNVLGLVGLVVLIACLNSSQGLWPSFSGERVYSAQTSTRAEPEHVPVPTISPVIKWPSGIELSRAGTQQRETNSSCSSQTKRRERIASVRQQTTKRIQLLSRKCTLHLASTVVDG